MSDARIAPSPFVVRCVTRARKVLNGEPPALDVAMGTGRHTLVLAEAGFASFGVDRDHGRQVEASGLLRDRATSARLWTADLERGNTLPPSRFDVVLCTRYLQRTLWPELAGAVRPGGFVIYETFTTAQRRYDWGPRSPDHLLEPDGELRRVFEAWDIWDYEERDNPVAEARLFARRPSCAQRLL